MTLSSIILQDPFPNKIFLGVIQINDHIRYKVFFDPKIFYEINTRKAAIED